MAIFVYPNSFGMPWEDREMDHIMLAFDNFLRQHSHPLLLRTQQQQQNQEQQQEQKQQQQSCKSCPSDQKSCCEEKENKSFEKDATNEHTRHRNYKSLTDQILDEFLQFYQGENLHRNQSLVNKDDRAACSFCSRNKKSTSKYKENKPLEKESASLPSRQNNLMNQTKRMFDDFLQLYNDRTHPQENIYLWNEGFLFPVRESSKSPFEVRVNLRDCDPDKVQVEVKDGILKVEGQKESEDGSSVYVKHERTIPKSVSHSSLKASFLSNGILKVIGQEEEEEKALPITMENDSNQLETKKEQDLVEPKTENQDKEEEKRT